MPTLLETTVAQIQPLDPQLTVQAQQHLDRLTKPPGSLGRLKSWRGAMWQLPAWCHRASRVKQ